MSGSEGSFWVILKTLFWYWSMNLSTPNSWSKIVKFFLGARTSKNIWRILMSFNFNIIIKRLSNNKVVFYTEKCCSCMHWIQEITFCHGTSQTTCILFCPWRNNHICNIQYKGSRILLGFSLIFVLFVSHMVLFLLCFLY